MELIAMRREALRAALRREFGIDQQSDGRLYRIIAAVDKALFDEIDVMIEAVEKHQDEYGSGYRQALYTLQARSTFK